MLEKRLLGFGFCIYLFGFASLAPTCLFFAFVGLLRLLLDEVLIELDNSNKSDEAEGLYQLGDLTACNRLCVVDARNSIHSLIVGFHAD